MVKRFLGRLLPAILFSAFVFAFFFCLARVICTPEQYKVTVFPDNNHSETLLVVADCDFEPYSFFDESGNPAGYDVELIYALANFLQVNVELKLMPWADCRVAIQKGEADLILALDYKHADDLEIMRTTATINDPFVSFGKEPFSNISDLTGKKIAALKESGCFMEILEPYGLTKNVTTYDVYTEVMRSVVSGENDYAIARYSVGRRILAKLGRHDVKAVGPRLANNSMSIGVSKGRGELRSALNNALRELNRVGVPQALKEKWLGSYVELISLGDIWRVYREAILFSIVAILSLTGSAVFYIHRKKARYAEKRYLETKNQLAYQLLLAEITESLFENMFEVDVTRNRVVVDSAYHNFSPLGLRADIPYDRALRERAENAVKGEFAEIYLNTFLPENILKAYQKGINRLSCDILVTFGGGTYFWMRITARIFRWQEDRSIRMIVYRKNIDEEKAREQELLNEAQRDAMTGLYNKGATERLVAGCLAEGANEGQPYALLVIDIDNFKGINDRFGHVFGDGVIKKVAETLKTKTREKDIVGRIGGDEFLIFLHKIPGKDCLNERLSCLTAALFSEVHVEGNECHVSTSIGAVYISGKEAPFRVLFEKADQALYSAKRKGKNGYEIYEWEEDGQG